MQNPAIALSLPPVTLSSIAPASGFRGTHYSLTIALVLLVGAFIACFLHFRFLMSNRVSAARIKARRHVSRSFAGTLRYNVDYPGSLDVAGHAIIKLGFIQLIYFFVTRGNYEVWIGISAAATAVLVILYREVEHMISPLKVRKRRYFLYRLGSTFARQSLIIGLILHSLYIVLLHSRPISEKTG